MLDIDGLESVFVLLLQALPAGGEVEPQSAQLQGSPPVARNQYLC